MSDNGVNVPLKWKISIEGAEQAKQRLADLDQQFTKQTITVSKYSQGQREVLRDVRSLNNEQRVAKEIYLASNPALNSFAKSMSTVGAVSNTLLGITSAINLAQIAAIGVNGQVTAAQQDLATAQRQYLVDLRDFPSDVALHEADLAKIAASQSNLAFVTREATYQQVTAWITLGSSVALISNSIVQAIPKVAGMISLLGSAQLAERFGILASAISSVGVASLGVLGPIGAIAAALYGVSYALINILPGMTGIIDVIKQQFGVNTLEAYLISPFYIWYKDLQILGGQVEEWAYNVVNGVINAFNVIPKTINSLHLPGISLGTIPNVTPPGFSGNGIQAFAEEQKNTTSKADQLVEIWTSTTTPTLTKISDSIQQGVTIQQAMQTVLQQQEDRAKSLQQSQAYSNQAAGIQSQIQTLQSQKVAPGDLSGVDAEFNKSQYLSNIASQNAKIDEQIKPLQDKLDQLEVGNQQALGGYLSSIGLDPNSGIGSVVSGALGGASAGWTQSDVDEFINTHDYGVFTRAANRDANPNGVTGGHGNGPTDQQQIDALANSLARNLGVDLATHPYLQQQAHDTLVKGKVIKGATGFDGIVSSATAFVAGESGAERVNIKPVGSNSSSGQNVTNFYITVQGQVLAENNLRDFISKCNKQAYKSRGFGL